VFFPEYVETVSAAKFGRGDWRALSLLWGGLVTVAALAAWLLLGAALWLRDQIEDLAKAVDRAHDWLVDHWRGGRL
jgi:hypothetical protein